jgi:hypothetical protein
MNLKKQDGFSITELMIIVTVSSLLATMVYGFWFYFWQYGTRSQIGLDTMSERLNTGDIIREYVGSSSGLIIQNSIADPNVHIQDSQNPGLGFWEEIHAIPGNKAGSGYVPVTYFKRPSIGTNNTILLNGTAPYEDEYIIYINNTESKLYLRTLANPDAPNNKAITTCPPQLATQLCPADKMLISGIASVDLRFFSRSGNLIDYTSSQDSESGDFVGPDYPVVEVIEYRLNVIKQVPGEPSNPIENSTIVRIALRNS